MSQGKIINLPVAIILSSFILGGFYYLTQTGDEQNQVTEHSNAPETESTEEWERLIDETMMSQVPSDDMKEVDEYTVHVIQLGGYGSQNIQSTIQAAAPWRDEDMEPVYIYPPKEYVSINFTKHRNAMWVGCAQPGYIVTECFHNEEDYERNYASYDDSLGCFVSLENAPLRNDINMKCTSHQKIYQNPHVLHLRRALNGYVDGSHTGILNPDSVIPPHRAGGMEAGLSRFDHSYYDSKFIVVDINDHPDGGERVDIIFRDNPDALFGAWIYSSRDNTYDLRGFWRIQAYNEQEQESLEMSYGRHLFDSDLAL